MVVVGPEDPLVKGIYDFFKQDDVLKNIPVIGPSKVGAQLEGSKEFAKKFLIKHNIPTAAYDSFRCHKHHQLKLVLPCALASLISLVEPYYMPHSLN